MRTIAFVAAAVFSTSFAVPASAQVYGFSACEALAVQRDSNIGIRVFHDFMRECMAGKIPMTVGGASQPPTVQHVLDAESYGYCQALAEQRDSAVGYNVHREFMKQCMAGQIPGR